MLIQSQLRELIIKPVLATLHMYSEDAVELLVFTCATESNGGTYLKQLNGPALGIYQMEPKTHYDLWRTYISPNTNLAMLMGSNFNAFRLPETERLIYDLYYATAICRLFYLRHIEPIPNCKDVEAIWAYYKKYYNTDLGAAIKDESIKKYRLFVAH